VSNGTKQAIASSVPGCSSWVRTGVDAAMVTETADSTKSVAK
jgi:hypothetical protein